VSNNSSNSPSPAGQALTSARETECDLIQYYRVLDNTSCNLGRGSPILASTVAILSYYWSGSELDAADIFAAISVFQALRQSMAILPYSYALLLNIATSLERIQAFLEEPDAPGVTYIAAAGLQTARESTVEEAEEGAGRGQGSRNAEVMLCVAGATLGWPPAAIPDTKGPRTECPATPVLRDVNLTLRRGQLAGVVGRVGTGKSTLISACVGEIAAWKGSISSHPDASYVAQSPFIISGTVLDNVLIIAFMSIYGNNH